MSDDRLKDLWASSTTEDRTMSTQDIARVIAPGIGRSARSVRWFVLIYGALLAATVALAVANMAGYRGNTTMVAVHAAAALVAAMLALFGWRLLRTLDGLDRSTESLVATLRRRLAFLSVPLEAWLWSAGVTIALLGFEVNALIDNQGGTYRVNHPVEFGIVLAVQVLIVYAAGKVRQRPAIGELRAALHDLEVGALEHSPRVEALRRRWRAWHWLLVVVLVLGVLAGLMMWLRPPA